MFLSSVGIERAVFARPAPIGSDRLPNRPRTAAE